jgi:hypothetical protein
MIKDYLCEIRNIISIESHNYQYTEHKHKHKHKHKQSGQTMHMQSRLDDVIYANNALISSLESNKTKNFHPISHYVGGTLQSKLDFIKIENNVDKISNQLNDLIYRIEKGDLHLTIEQIHEIAKDSIEMVKFLGKLVDETKNKQFGVIQGQIADIVQVLIGYLDNN